MNNSQQNSGSQRTLISTKMVKELDLQNQDSTSFRTEPMIGEKIISADLVKFDMQLLVSDEVFSLSNVVTHTSSLIDVDILPHRQDVGSYPHFQNIDLLYLPNNDSVDLLIGNENAFLKTVLVRKIPVM